nr:cuticle protein 7-like [Procambarus clarkii]
MKAVALVILAGVAASAAAWAAPQGGYNYQQPAVQGGGQYPDAPAQYNFQWDVNDEYSGNFYGHREQRDGDNTQGTYFVRLPDTRLMRVDYYADESGYHPTITYEGEAQYPSAPARGYAQPASTPSQGYSLPALAHGQPASAPRQVYSQPASPPRQVYSQPASPPRQVYSQPASPPRQVYSQPAQQPSQFYTQPGK